MVFGLFFGEFNILKHGSVFARAVILFLPLMVRYKSNLAPDHAQVADVIFILVLVDVQQVVEYYARRL